MAAPAPTTIVLDVSALAADGQTIDALARLQLLLRRRGQRLQLRDATEELRKLIAFVGLSAVLGMSVADGEGVDRLVQTDARAKPARPAAGIASDALSVEPPPQAEQGSERR